MSTTRREPRASSGISIQTLVIASVSSLAAAIVVHKLWQGGAIVGAAVTPIIVGIVGEALRHPVDRLTAVKDGGRRLPPGRDHDVAPASRERGDDPFGLWEDRTRRRSRGRTWLALGAITGVIGFAIGAFVLTGSELVFGGSVAGPDKTTIFSGGGRRTTTTVQTVVTQTTTSPATVTQTVPAPAATETTTTQTVPTAPQPGVAPQQATPTTTTPTTTAPPGTTTP